MSEEKKEVAVSKLSAEECLAELEELKGAGVQFDVEFSDETPLKELRSLVKDGRKALGEEGKDESAKGDSTSGESKDETKSEGVAKPEPTPEPIRTSQRSATMLTVVCNPVEKTRTYSEKTHGKNWKILAHQYAENMKRKGFMGELVEGGI